MAGVARQDGDHWPRVMAWLSVGEDAGEVAGPMVAGLVWSAWGVPALLVFRILVAIGAELVTVVVTRRHGLTVTAGGALDAGRGP